MEVCRDAYGKNGDYVHRTWDHYERDQEVNNSVGDQWMGLPFYRIENLSGKYLGRWCDGMENRTHYVRWELNLEPSFRIVGNH